MCAAESDARHKQMEFEDAVQHGEPPSPALKDSEDILYDDIDSNNVHVFDMQQCPAYAPLPPPRS